MPTLTTHTDPSGASATTLHVALDLGNTSWCLACAPAVSEAPRVRVFPARTLPRLHAELATARQHFGLPPDTPIVLCYEAGRDGFWLQRACAAAGLTASLSTRASVPARARRAKTDRLDAAALLRLLPTRGRRAWALACSTCRPSRGGSPPSAPGARPPDARANTGRESDQGTPRCPRDRAHVIAGPARPTGPPHAVGWPGPPGRGARTPVDDVDSPHPRAAATHHLGEGTARSVGTEFGSRGADGATVVAPAWRGK
jgi:hypothetical protein